MKTRFLPEPVGSRHEAGEFRSVETDDTDHFVFVHECGARANVVSVETRKHVGGTAGCVYLSLHCPTCRRDGTRKIYANDPWQESPRGSDGP